VSDNGIGIPKESQFKIFEIFRREHTAKKYPGTGIGLSICKKIVDRHKGKIWFHSEPGKGTTFYFTLKY
jgi:signal transduction histidine kinase